ncbi:hypothetical protein GQ54DRAFT_324019 [Martensiomyces pterosporus]|nr:hypothetical protein GQ54DRAFT_324019 [Martensiomyces pterosporus]
MFDMVWSCFCAASPDYITMVEAAMDGKGSHAILASDLVNSLGFYNEQVVDPISIMPTFPKPIIKKITE